MVNTNQKLSIANSKPYLGWLREQLSTTNCKVRKWLDWDPDNGEYLALIDSRMIITPIPVCDWSFLVALHELGHVSTGYRLHSYLMEYNAEKWAIKRAEEAYGIACPEYVEDAKNYVRNHLVENLSYTGLSVDKVKPYVLDWLGETKQSILEIAALQNN